MKIQVPRNSVGPRQLQAKAVTGGKIAEGAVTSSKIAEATITGQNIDMGALGTVPQAANATAAQNANTVDEHAASCPQGSTLIRGLCFDAGQTRPSTRSRKQPMPAPPKAAGCPPRWSSTRSAASLTWAKASALNTSSPMSSTATPTAPTTRPWSSTGPARSQSLKSAAPPPNTPASIRWCGRQARREIRSGGPCRHSFQREELLDGKANQLHRLR